MRRIGPHCKPALDGAGRLGRYGAMARPRPKHHDPALPVGPNMRRLAAALAAEPGRLTDRLPGGRARLWQRLRARVAEYGDPQALVALDDHGAGRALDIDSLRVVALMLARTGDHDGYERTLRDFDPALTFSAVRARRFIGNGSGMEALNVFRRLGKAQIPRFEKIFICERSGLARTLLAMKQVLPAHPGLNTPALIEARRGDRLAAVEFVHVRFTPLPPGEIKVRARVVRHLGEIAEKAIGGNTARYHRQTLPEGARETIAALLEAAGADHARHYRALFGRCQALADSLPRVFCHGDLNHNNVSREGVVLDWDKAGFLPYGHDAAYACRRRRPGGADDLLALSAKHFERPGRAAQDRFAFAWFFLHMIPSRPELLRNTALLAGLVEKLHALADAAAHELGRTE
ncbi:MAG: phosphotransferase [Pararhodobacter sp.]|nr:phosphotransferase [Pararhodobacter sp.]